MVKYKPYKNKSSLQQRNARLLQGGKTDINGSKLGWWERKTPNTQEHFVVEIDINTSKRPDLLSIQHYDTAAYDWIILQYNNIVDINEEFIVGNKVKMPTIAFIRAYILNSPVRGHV